MSFRFAAVISHPIQHYAPVFRDLACVPGLDVRVFYSCDWGVRPTFDPGFGCEFSWDVPLLEGYEYEFLPRRRAPRNQGFWQIDNARVGDRLAAFAPHAMWIHGYGHRVCWRALRWARQCCAALYFGDSELLHQRAAWRRALKTPLVRWFFRQCDAFITIGDNNEAYYSYYGVPREKMFRGACAIDVRRFQQAIAAPDGPTRAEVRARFGIAPDQAVVIYSAKMIDIKRPLDLVLAMGLLRDRGVRGCALFLGDGPLRPALEETVRSRGLEDRIKWAGFVNQREMPRLLNAGDILAMTSDKDPHPLAVTESMAVGHAIVASDRVGCVGVSDSARPGVNTLVYPVGDVVALADRLQRLIEDEALRARMARASLELVVQQDTNVTIQAVLRAIGALRPKFGNRWNDVPESFFADCTRND